MTIVVAVAAGLAAPPGPAAAAPTEPLWVGIYAAPSGGESYVDHVAVDPTTGNVVVAGSSPRVVSQQGVEYNWDYATLAYRANGQLVGTKVYEYRGPREPGVHNRDDVSNAMTVHPGTGTVYVTGYSEGTAATGVDVATVAYDRSGRQLWEARYAEPSDDDGRYLTVDPDSGTIVVGAAERTLSGLGITWVVLAYSPAGQLLWSDRFGSPDVVDQLRGVAFDPDTDTVYVTGSVTNPAGDTDVALRAYSLQGELRWTAQYDGGVDGDESATTIAVQGDTVYLSGSSEEPGTRAALLTLAYSTTGQRLWVKRFTEPAADYSAEDLAVDPATGDVVVFGSRETAPLRVDFATISYSASGQRRWVAAYNSPGSDEDYPAAVALDSARGIAYVVGSSRVTLDFVHVLIAYRLSDGEQVRFDTFVSGRGGFAVDVAVDPQSGTVFVAGDMDGDVTTVAYPPAGAS